MSDFTLGGAALDANKDDEKSPSDILPEAYSSKMNSIEHVREYLETCLGEDLLMKIYPILLDIGDDVFYENQEELL